MTRVEAWLDKLDIQDVLVRYAHALDSRDHRLLDDVFLPDADIDYTVVGGVRGNLRTWQDWLHPAMSRFDSWQHLMANFVIDLDGDRATALTRCHNPLQGRHADGTSYVLHAGAHYRDSLIRTAEGWRIHKRVLGIDWQDAGQPV